MVVSGLSRVGHARWPWVSAGRIVVYSTAFEVKSFNMRSRHSTALCDFTVYVP